MSDPSPPTDGIAGLRVCRYCRGSGEDGDPGDTNGEGAGIWECETCNGTGLVESDECDVVGAMVMSLRARLAPEPAPAAVTERKSTPIPACVRNFYIGPGDEVRLPLREFSALCAEFAELQRLRLAPEPTMDDEAAYQAHAKSPLTIQEWAEGALALRLAFMAGIKRGRSTPSSPEPGELERLRELVVEAFPVMNAHAARHIRKADNDRSKETWRTFHQNRADSSNAWLDKAGVYYNAAQPLTKCQHDLLNPRSTVVLTDNYTIATCIECQMQWSFPVTKEGGL